MSTIERLAAARTDDIVCTNDDSRERGKKTLHLPRKEMKKPRIASSAARAISIAGKNERALVLLDACTSAAFANAVSRKAQIAEEGPSKPRVYKNSLNIIARVPGVACPTNGKKSNTVPNSTVSKTAWWQFISVMSLPVGVLLADDSDVMRTAICRVLKEEPAVKVVGMASSFAQTMQMIADFKPDVLLIDLHLPEERNFAADFVKSQLVSVPHVLAISVSNDEEAQQLAKGYGAAQLLDKMKLFDELIPAILAPSTLERNEKPI